MPETGYVELTLMFEREGRKWVGTCLELGTSTYERTLERVEESIHQLVIDHLNLLEEAQERQRFFREHGITFHSVKPRPHEIRIPIPAGHRGVPRRQFFQPGVFPVPPVAKGTVTRQGLPLAAG